MHCDAASAQSEWTELLKKLGSKREAPQMIDGLLRVGLCPAPRCFKILLKKKGKVGNYNMVK